MDVHCVFIYLFCILLTGSTRATALVVSSPRDVTVANGTWASFECRISCTHVFYWFVGSGRYRRLTNVDVNRFVQRNHGIQVEVSNSNECTDNGDYTQQLRILATPKVNGIAVQCAAVSRPPTANGVFFSSYAVLMVEPIEPTEVTMSSGVATCHIDELSPQPTPAPSSMCPSPSPLPVVCPDPSPEISTSSVTVTVTETPPVITVTSVLVRIVTVTPNPSSPPEPNSNFINRPSKVRAQTLPEGIIPAEGTTTNSGQLRLSGLPSSIILLTVLLVTAMLQL